MTAHRCDWCLDPTEPDDVIHDCAPDAESCCCPNVCADCAHDAANEGYVDADCTGNWRLPDNGGNRDE